MPRKKLTEEEKLAKRIAKAKAKDIENIKYMTQSSLEDCQERYDIPEPSYFHEVGDIVRYGNWDWTGILRVYEGGKYYKCFSITWKTNTNRHYPYHEYKIHYMPWYDLGFLLNKLNVERFEEDEDVRISYQQRDLSSLLMMMFDVHGIDLEPEYQRGNVWSDEQKYDLIESIFKNIDIGKFTIIRRPWGDNPNVPMTPKLHEMLDGKQRITALFDFYTGKFKYKDKYFCELHWRDQHHFKYYNINWGESSPLTKEQKYRYFLKLNATGKPISKKHIDKVRKMWESEIIDD